MIKTSLIAILFFFVCNNLLSQNVDINLLNKINPANPNSSFWLNTTNSSYPITIGVQGGLIVYDYFHSDSTRKRIPFHIAENLVVLGVTEFLKITVNRTRPYITYPTLIHPYDASEKNQSFSSAHTSLAFNTAATLSIRFHKWYITVPAYLWASCVGYSRLYLGEHYPSDVLAGTIVGIGSAYLESWIDKKINSKKFHK